MFHCCLSPPFLTVGFFPLPAQEGCPQESWRGFYVKACCDRRSGDGFKLEEV